MAALVKVLKFSSQLAKNKQPLICIAVRHNMNRVYKPGPLPTTEEERKKAAEKYNLHPDRYETYPDDGLSIGDYPKIPMVSGDSKDPFYPWDFPEFKRNYNEPIHESDVMINETRYDCSYQHRVPMWKQWTIFLGVMSTFGLLYYIMEDYKMYRAVLPKQLAKDGPHYLFPGSESSGGH